MSRSIAPAVVALLLAIISTSTVAAEQTRFDSYRVYSVKISDEQQLRQLRGMDGTTGYDMWRSARHVGATAAIMVSPQKNDEFNEIVTAFGVETKLMVDNVQRLIDDGRPASGRATANYGWTNYYDLDATYAWLDNQIAAFPNILTNLTVGQSAKGRSIRAVKLSHKAGNPIIFIEANIHAREWITSATATWLLNELLTSSDPAVQELAHNYDWVVVPVFNVDGFQYSHETNRMWRKNRNPAYGHICYGVDLNRNFDFHFMESGASQNICSESYAGPYADSEPETRALVKFMQSMDGNIKIFMSLHSYGQYLLFPYSYADILAPEHEKLMAISEKFKEAVAVRYGTNYTVGPSASTIYPTAGSSDDWAYGELGVKMSFTVELRDHDDGPYGFLLPADQIVPNGLELLDGIQALIEEGHVQSLL